MDHASKQVKSFAPLVAMNTNKAVDLLIIVGMVLLGGIVLILSVVHKMIYGRGGYKNDYYGE